jgi:DNA-binding winged helix-turn-helix (wHTH) protein/TolB-like protein/Flp pilus assembly protein TadD
MAQQATDLYEFGPFQIDTQNRLLFRDGQPVPLKPKVIDTLLLLVENSGRVLEKDELIEKLWPETFVDEANLTQNIYVLRKALTTGADSTSYIETIPRRGYRFTGDVKKISAGATVVEAETGTTRTTGTGPRWMWVAVGVALVAILGALAFRLLASRSRPAVSSSSVKSLAVLPFRPLTGGSEDDYIGQGMADALITKLSNTQRLNVRPTSAVLRYNNANIDPIAAGRALDVEAVLDGKVQRVGDRVRVTVQLLRVADGASLWADQYDEDFTGIFALQDSISAQAARSLTLQLTGNEAALMRKHYTQNARAYESYLQGRYFWNKRNTASFRKAIEYFEQALAVDSNYALAYAGLADSYIRLNESGAPMNEEAVPKAKAAIMKALAIDDSLGEAHATLGFIKFRHDWDFAGADSEFKRAVELNPNYSEAHQWYAFYLLAVGKTNEADAEIKRGQELDPLSVSFNSNLAIYLFFRHDFERSITQARKTLEMEPDFSQARATLGLSYEQKSSNKEAIAELTKAQQASGDVAMASWLGHALAQDGQTKEARRILSEIEEYAKKNYVPPYNLAVLHVGLGERQQAMDLLEKGFADRSLRPVWVKFDPRLDGLRQDGQFLQLIQRMGL